MTQERLTILRNNESRYEHDANEHAWPWMVDLLDDKVYILSDSTLIISILTDIRYFENSFFIIKWLHNFIFIRL